MAKLLLELIVLVLLISLVSCQISSHSYSENDVSFSSSISFGTSSESISDDCGNLGTESSSIGSSDSYLPVSEEYPFGSDGVSSGSYIPGSEEGSSSVFQPTDHQDFSGIENGCAFFTEFYFERNQDLEVLDILKDFPSITNCSSLDNSISKFQTFSNNIRSLCPSNDTAMSKSEFIQIEEFLTNDFGKAIFEESKNEGCNILSEAYYVILSKFTHYKGIFVGDVTDS